MVSHLILIFGLVCAGAVADLDLGSRDYAGRSLQQDWSGRPGLLNKRRCSSRKNDDKSVTTEPPLDLPNNDGKCRSCKTLINGLIEYIGDGQPDIHYLPYYCGSLDVSQRAQCFRLIDKYGKNIINLLSEHKSAFEVCVSIQQCHGRKNTEIYCSSCMDYVHLGSLFGYNTYSWEQRACMDFYGTDRTLCTSSLQNAKNQLMALHDQNVNTNANQMCQSVQMCAPSYPAPVVYSSLTKPRNM